MEKSNKITIKTTWGKIFKEGRSHITLFNNFPEILNRLDEWEELSQWSTYDDEEDCYDEIYQWYIVDDFTAEWLEDFCPEISEDVHWSDTIGHYIMAVHHYGTSWDDVGATLEMDGSNETLVKIYKDSYEVKE